MRVKFFPILLWGLVATTPYTFAQTPDDAQLHELEKKQAELLKKEQELLNGGSAQTPDASPAKSKKDSKKKDNSANAGTPRPVITGVSAPTPTMAPPTPTATPSPIPTIDQLAQAQATIDKLKKELNDTKNRLALSETEVDRLSVLIDNRQKIQPANSGTSRVAPPQKNPEQYNQNLRVRDPSEIQSKVEGDMQIATVIAEKAQLRTGPGMNNSPLMTVGQGTRLAIETRNGDWYRVVSPTGARAWVSADVLDVGGKRTGSLSLPARIPNPGSGQLPADMPAAGKGNAVDNGGFPTDAEAAAFQALQLGSKKSQ